MLLSSHSEVVSLNFTWRENQPCKNCRMPHKASRTVSAGKVKESAHWSRRWEQPGQMEAMPLVSQTHLLQLVDCRVQLATGLFRTFECITTTAHCRQNYCGPTFRMYEGRQRNVTFLDSKWQGKIVLFLLSFKRNEVYSSKHFIHILYLLRAFVKLRKATFSFVMSVRPSVRMEQLGSHWTDSDESWYLSFSWKYVDKIQFSLKSGKNNGYFTLRRFDVYDNI